MAENKKQTNTSATFQTATSYIYLYTRFFCVKCKLSIEIDGNSHLKSEQIEYDLQRTAYLNSLGIKEIRFTNQEVERDLDAVIAVIQKNIEVILKSAP